MKYLRPRLPEKEIELCLDLFDKQEAKKRILKYIEGVFDDAESQLKNCFIHDVMPAFQHSDDMCFHECPDCNCRCNCSNQPCSCCNEV